MNKDSRGNITFYLQRLTDIVLGDILAALPMREVVRMMQFPSKKLKTACSKSWVINRMTAVDFASVVKAWRAGGRVRRTLCIDSVFTRLYGRIVLKCGFFPSNMIGSVNVFELIPGPKHVISHGLGMSHTVEFIFRVTKRGYIGTIPYITVVQDMDRCVSLDMLRRNIVPHDLIFCYEYNAETKDHRILFDSMALNGRHVLDVVRGFSEPNDTSEERVEDLKVRAYARVEPIDPYYSEEYDHLSLVNFLEGPPIIQSDVRFPMRTYWPSRRTYIASSEDSFSSD